MKGKQPIRVSSISEYHQLVGLPQPEHPLISVVRFEAMAWPREQVPVNLLLGFYTIALKRGFLAKLNYGQQSYDFNDGLMAFMSPGQVLSIEIDWDGPMKHEGWLMLVHPDFLWKTSLAKNIKQFEFFDYAVHEALFLSEKEEAVIDGIFTNIKQEYHTNIDRFTQNIIISQLETLLNYAERFYQRQFVTRRKSNDQLLARMEKALADYFDNAELSSKGLPTVIWLSETLHVSPGYLSNSLKSLTGKSTQQHIQDKVIEKAKELLSTTDQPVSEIAYVLGFGYSQSFSKLFKSKTNLSPLEFRQSYN